MNKLPLELWKIIMEYSEPETQVTIKLLCKFLYDNLQFDNLYLNAIKIHANKYFEEKDIMNDDLIRYLIRINNYSKATIITLIQDIIKHKNELRQNCKGHIFFEYDDTNEEIVECMKCDYKYWCEECNRTSIDNYNISHGLSHIIQSEYSIIKCLDCGELVNAYLCRDCGGKESCCLCHKTSY